MQWTRREFLETMSASALVPGPWARVRQGAPVEASMDGREPFPPAALVADFLAGVRHSTSRPRATGLSRDEYTRLIDGVATFFAAFQDGRGAIIDPYEKRERQYSTPAFALSAAVLGASKRNLGLLPAAARAMECACADLATGKAADQHADFYTVLLLHADIVLSGLVPASTCAGWRRHLEAIVAEQAYVNQPASGRPLHNWNLVAAAGEHLRCREGYGRSDAWVEASVARQVEHFTAAGMYRDPNDPMAYDHFARLWALDLVEEGYAGAHADRLRAWLEKAAWASLFMQSPHGELPCGGRSGHHQWNEAEQAVTFETFARNHARRGDLLAAGAFKRAARLSARSIGRWVRPSGELWVVKNRMDARQRHGYETYSFHSQYNLLTAAMLALAWLRADDTISEGRCPVETTAFVFDLRPAFHKAFIGASGTFVEVDTSADLHYNPTGIVRIQHPAVPPETFSDGVTRECDYQVPARPPAGFALGPAWQDGSGRWHSLAEHGRDDLQPADLRVVRTSRGRVEAELVYLGGLRGGATSVRERIVVAGDGVTVEHSVAGEVRAVRQTYPFLVTDGAQPSGIAVDGRRVSVSRGGGTMVFEALGNGPPLRRFSVSAACRNGFMDAAYAESSERTVRCLVTFAGNRP
jgi:hypothetical protein